VVVDVNGDVVDSHRDSLANIATIPSSRSIPLKLSTARCRALAL